MEKAITEKKNEGIVLKMIEAFNKQDIDSWIDYFADDADVVGPDGERMDKDKLRNYYLGVFKAFPDGRFGIERMMSKDDSIVVEIFGRGTQKGEYFGIPATNKRIELPMTFIMDFKDGRVKRWRAYYYYQKFVSQILEF